MAIGVAHSSQGAPPLLVRTVRNTRRLESGDVYLVGRNPESAIELSDPRVSWVHAALLVEDGVWVLHDPAPGFSPSRNGTFHQGSDRVSRLEITGPCVVHFGNPEDGPVLRFEPQPLASEEEVTPRASEGDTTFLPGVYRDPTSRFRLQSKVIKIGRRPDNDVVLSDLGVSKQHAELRLSSTGRYQIIDLGSHNGTFVNGVRVNQAELTENDIVSIGHATFRLAGGELREYIDEGNVSFEAHDLEVVVNDGGKQKFLLRGITFPLAERSMMAVIGPAGSGKSTLLNALTGKRPANKGEVLYDYRNLYDSYDELKHRIGLVPQQSVTHDQLTARSALGYAAELRFPPDAGEAERDQRVDEVLAELSMTPHANTRIDRLSGGQQKRVNIGLELLTKPSLLFLDEPTSPLDPHLKRDLFRQMRKMADPDAPAGQSIVVITHDVEQKLIDQCDRLIVLAPGGQMAYFGPPAEGLRYFGADDWADVFQSFADQPERDWAAEFRGSTDYAKYVATPISVRERQQQAERSQEEEAAVGSRKRGLLTQVGTMARRYRRVMVADRVFMVTTIVMPVVLGLLVRLMPSPQGLTGSMSKPNDGAVTLLMIMVMSAVLSGTALSIREFIKEREIFERERMAGLSATAYLLSKVVVLSIIAVLQVLLIVLVGLAGRAVPSRGALIPGSALIEIFVGMAVLCVVSMLLGLAVSTLVTKSDQTMPLLVGITMVQVALSGGMFPLTGPGSWLSLIAPARGGFAAIASSINLNAINPLDKMNPVLRQQTEKPDALWAHTPGQWITNVAIMLIIGAIVLLIARARLGSIGPRRRR